MAIMLAICVRPKVLATACRSEALCCSPAHLQGVQTGLLQVHLSLVASCKAHELPVDCPVLQSKYVGDNTVVRFNHNYCPELGAAMALGIIAPTLPVASVDALCTCYALLLCLKSRCMHALILSVHSGHQLSIYTQTLQL